MWETARLCVYEYTCAFVNIVWVDLDLLHGTRCGKQLNSIDCVYESTYDLMNIMCMCLHLLHGTRCENRQHVYESTPALMNIMCMSTLARWN